MQQNLSNPSAGSLAEMARRDLDAALELLVDRAQYITGASGAAIALRRDGKNDMLCRASAGSNAPEIGALLSTEFGLSGESVRTRKPLRCDNADTDIRVNREVCRRLGIASVVVMPVANDDEVLGVFELFSGKAGAFGDRDLSAVRRLSEMVETAVRLAHATEKLPERLKGDEKAASAAETEEDKILEGQAFEVVLEEPEELVLEDASSDKEERKNATASAGIVAEVEKNAAAKVEAAKPVGEKGVAATSEPTSAKEIAESKEDLKTEKVQKAADAKSMVGASMAVPEKSAALEVASETASLTANAAASGVASEANTVPPAPVRKPLFWSAAMNSAVDATKAPEPDQSDVPPVLRSLQKCVACGFPVSAGRLLCVECEEKKWRGQLRSQRSSVRQPAQVSPTASAASPINTERGLAAAHSAAVGAGATSSVTVALSGTGTAGKAPQPAIGTATHVSHSTVVSAAPVIRESTPDFVLSAGLAPSQSWFSRNKYVISVLLAIAAAAAAAFFLMR